MIWVAFGSEGGEGEVSSRSGQFVKSQLDELKIDSRLVELSSDNVLQLIEQDKPTKVFNAMHGSFGEDGQLPTILDFYQIPYTHSNACASFLGMRKAIAKSILIKKGVPFARGFDFPLVDFLNLNFIEMTADKVKKGELHGDTFVLKPENLGSSLYLIKFDLRKKDDIASQVEMVKAEMFAHNGAAPYRFMIEEAIIGREFDVIVFDAVNGSPIVGVAEVVLDGNVYTYDVKYNSPKSVVDFNPNIPANLEDELCKYGLLMHQTLGCKDVSRSEFIVRNIENNPEIFAIELNTHPGLRVTSCAVNLPALRGIDNISFVENILLRAF